MTTPAAKWKQIIITAVEHAELQEVDAPAAPLGDNEVEGRQLVSLISAGTELACVYTSDKYLPAGPGYAAVFQVDAVGKNVTDIKPGQNVFCMGLHRSHQRLDRSMVLPLPENLAPETAVFARMMGVSMTTLMTTAARPGAVVLVTGLGMVGNLAAQMAACCGYEVTAVDPDEAKRRLAEQVGLKRVHPAVPMDQLKGRVELVIECSGHEQAVLDGCKVVRRGGEVALVGVPWKKRTSLSAFDILHEIFHNYAVLRTGWEWEVPLHTSEFAPNSIFKNFATALRWLADGRIRVAKLADKISPDKAQEAYQNLLHNHCGKLSYIFDWR